MLHDASGPTWRQTCFLPAATPDAKSVDLGIAVLGRFASHGNFTYRQTAAGPGLHIVHSGEGWFRSGGREWKVGPGGVFCFAPGFEAEYGDSKERPWRYTWLVLVGRRVPEISAHLGGGPGPWARDDLPTRAVAGLLDGIEAAFRSEDHSPYFPEAAAWRVVDALSPPAAERDRAGQIAHAVKRILDAQFTAPLKLGALAQQLGIDRSTLFRRFSELYGCAPKPYLDRIRLEHGAALLRDGALGVAEIAARCGFGGPARFAKAFRARYGVPPTRWRG